MDLANPSYKSSGQVELKNYAVEIQEYFLWKVSHVKKGLNTSLFFPDFEEVVLISPNQNYPCHGTYIIDNVILDTGLNYTQ